MQDIAQGCAQHGWQTDYICLFSSLFDLIGKRRRERFSRVWLKHQGGRGVEVEPNLREYAFHSFFPANKRILRFGWQLKTYSAFVPDQFKKKAYDVCIFDTTPNVILLPHLKADHYIFRLNDLPQGFQFQLHSRVLEIFETFLRQNKCSEIWAVSNSLADYAREHHPGCPVLVIPNGIPCEPFLNLLHAAPNSKSHKKAVFVGSIEKWVDQALIDATARILQDWSFDFYGHQGVKWSVTAPNVKYKGILNSADIPQKLQEYCVGLVPFKDVDNLIGVMERPLKFYEYVGSGLGIASTDVGALRTGMHKWAFFGSTPENFARAVVKACSSAKSRTIQERQTFINKHSWADIMRKFIQRIDQLVNHNQMPS